MSRVEAASGAKYTAQKEAPRAYQPIAPVGTNYQPVGKVDMAALKRNVPPPLNPSTATKPVVSSTVTRSVPLAPSPAAGLGRAPLAGAGRTTAPAGAWPAEAPSTPAAPPPPPAATRPAVGGFKPSAAVSSLRVAYAHTVCPDIVAHRLHHVRFPLLLHLWQKLRLQPNQMMTIALVQLVLPTLLSNCSPRSSSIRSLRERLKPRPSLFNTSQRQAVCLPRLWPNSDN